MEIIFGGSILLVLIGSVLTRRMHMELFRDRVFQIREAWFDLALDEQSSLEFDSDLYRSMERVLCYVLRTAGFYSIASVIYFIIRKNATAEMTIDSAINRIDDTYTMRKCIEVKRRLGYATHNYMCARSIVYRLWSILLQPSKEPTSSLLNETEPALKVAG